MASIPAITRMMIVASILIPPFLSVDVSDSFPAAAVNLSGFLSAIDDDAEDCDGQHACDNSNDDRCLHIHSSFPVCVPLRARIHNSGPLAQNSLSVKSQPHILMPSLQCTETLYNV